MVVELGPHQIKAVGDLKNGSILKGGVGSGKSRVAIAYYYLRECGGGVKINGQGDFKPMSTPKDLYIITTAKKRDSKEWLGECAPFAISSVPEDSVSGVKVTIDSWNNIAKYKDVEDAFFIFDEQRLVGSGAWVKAFLSIAKRNRWIVLSATPGDVWMDYAPVFIAHGFHRNRTEFKNRHVVYSPYTKYPKIDRYVDVSYLERCRDAVLVHMPYKSHTKRNVINVHVDHNKELFNRVVKDRWNIYEERPIKDVSELFRVMRKLVNSDKDRIAKVEELMKKHPRIIIFYNFNYELELLRELLKRNGVTYAEWNGHRHMEIPNEERWIYLVQYTAGSEGWNAITTDTIIFYSLNYSYKINEQAKGRIDRFNTPYTDLYYYILRSDSMIDRSIMKAITSKKNFNEAAHFKGSAHF